MASTDGFFHFKSIKWSLDIYLDAHEENENFWGYGQVAFQKFSFTSLALNDNWISFFSHPYKAPTQKCYKYTSILNILNSWISSVDTLLLQKIFA